MHKDMAHRLVEHAGILVPKALMLNREEYRTCRERLEEMLAQKQIGFSRICKAGMCGIVLWHYKSGGRQLSQCGHRGRI